jgi:hypothetical protein
MNVEKRDEATTTNEPSGEALEGGQRLQLSVKRMKKLRSSVGGGGSTASFGTMSWA